MGGGTVTQIRPPNTPTVTELKCLEALAELGSIAAVAESLEIADQTVKNRLASLRGKLEVPTNLQAYALLVKGVTFSASVAVHMKLERDE